MKELEEEIEYYNSYKKRLIQFIIHSCSYAKEFNTMGRVRLTANEVLDIIKEISVLEILIYDLKLLKNPVVSAFNYANNKHFN